jgi:hypothetical protein
MATNVLSEGKKKKKKTPPPPPPPKKKKRKEKRTGNKYLNCIQSVYCNKFECSLLGPQ